MLTFLITCGSICDGIKNPPINIEGRKNNWAHKTVARVFAEATPISTPSPVLANSVSMNTNKNLTQLRGSGASKNIDPVETIMTDTTIICSIIVRGGIITIDEAGTPLTL